MIILEFVHLRESRDFWLDQGVYPARLRSLVRQMFYPLVFTQGVLLFVASWLIALSEPAEPKNQTAQLATLWILLAGGLFAAMANNLTNVLEGRPLHWHP